MQLFYGFPSLKTVETVKTAKRHCNSNATLICFTVFTSFIFFPETCGMMACLGHPISSKPCLKNNQTRKRIKQQRTHSYSNATYFFLLFCRF